MPIYKTDKKKDGKQQYRVIVCYTDNFGKPHNVERTAYGLADAKATESILRNEIKNKPLSSRMTVQQLYDEYIKIKRQEVRETTLDKTISNLNQHILPYFKDIKLQKLCNKALLQEWKVEIGNRDISIRTKKNIFSEFRTMLNYAVKMEYLPNNPLSAIGNFKDVFFEDSLNEKLHYYTADEFHKYISVAKTAAEKSNFLIDWGYYVFFNIAFYTGMRKGEINALKWSDLEGNIIHVRRSVAQKLKGRDIVETPPKNKSSYRSLQVPLPLLEILNEHKKRHQQDSRFSEDFRICGGVSCLRDTSIENRNKKFADAAGLPHIRIHDFRHTHASLLVNEGINIQEIARRLGHSNIQMTWQTYSHLYPREEERAVEILNKV